MYLLLGGSQEDHLQEYYTFKFLSALFRVFDKECDPDTMNKMNAEEVFENSELFNKYVKRNSKVFFRSRKSIDLNLQGQCKLKLLN